jgi:hypothetical protein
MAWRNFGRILSITRRRRIVASAVIYGLSLTVRFTSAAEAPASPGLGANPMTSVMINDSAHVFTRNWPARFAQPAVFRHGSSQRGCGAACAGATPAPFMQDCAVHP